MSPPDRIADRERQWHKRAEIGGASRRKQPVAGRESGPKMRKAYMPGETNTIVYSGFASGPGRLVRCLNQRQPQIKIAKYPLHSVVGDPPMNAAGS